MGEAKNIYFTCLKKVNLKFRIMGRMHAPGKGISQSALPYRRSLPTWLKLSSEDVKDQIYKLAKKGLTPSQIGVILRFPRRGSGEIRDGNQSFAHFESERIGLGNSRGSLPHDQKSRLHQKTFGKKQKGSRREIPSHFDGISDPSSGSLLQDQARSPSHLEVRVFHRLRPRRLKIL